MLMFLARNLIPHLNCEYALLPWLIEQIHAALPKGTLQEMCGWGDLATREIPGEILC